MIDRVKKYSSILILLIIAVAGGLVYFSVKYLSNHYLEDKTGPITAAPCQAVNVEHVVVIKDNKMNPDNLNAGFCDKLTIINEDTKLRRIAFGQHDQHVAYNGIVEKPLREGQSFSVELNQTGEFIFHDHLQEEVQATFTVK